LYENDENILALSSVCFNLLKEYRERWVMMVKTKVSQYIYLLEMNKMSGLRQSATDELARDYNQLMDIFGHTEEIFRDKMQDAAYKKMIADVLDLVQRCKRPNGTARRKLDFLLIKESDK
jgi:hypothetical protein